MNTDQNVLRIAAVDAASLANELQDRMIGMEVTNGFLGAKEPGGDMNYYAPQGADANFNSVTVTKTTPTLNQELASKLYVDYVIQQVTGFDAELVDGNGVHSGMEITVGSPNNTFSISAGTYHEIGVGDVVYAGIENVPLTYIADVNQTYIAIEIATTNVIQSGSPFTPAQRRLVVILGVVVHTNNSTVNAINNLPDVAQYTLAQLNDFMDGLNSFNIDGNVISAKGANLQLKKSLGEIFKRGSNFQTDPNDPHTRTMDSLDPVTNIRMRQYNGDEGIDLTAIESPLRWENNGVLVNLSSNRWGVYRVVLFSSNLIRIQYPQHQYQSLVEAQNAIQTEEYIVENNMKQNGLLRGFIIIKQGTTALNNTSFAKFIEADKFGYNIAGGAGGGITTLQGAYNNSAEPEIITDDTRQALTLKKGGIYSGNVLEIKNSSDDIVANIDSAGNIVSEVGMRVSGASQSGSWLSETEIKVAKYSGQALIAMSNDNDNGRLDIWSGSNGCSIAASVNALNITTGGIDGLKMNHPHTTDSKFQISTDINPKVLVSREYLEDTVNVTAQGVIDTIQTTDGFGAFTASNASVFTEGSNTHLYLGNVTSSNGIIDGNGSLVMVVDNDEISTTDAFFVRSRDADTGVTVFKVIQNENTTTGGVPSAPASSNTKIDNVGNKALITKEYGDMKYGQLNKTITIENPINGDNIGIFRTDVEIDVSEVNAVLTGSGGSQSVGYTIKHGQSRAIATANVATGTVTSTGIGSTGTLVDAGLDANDWVWVELSSIVATVTSITIDIRYTVKTSN